MLAYIARRVLLMIPTILLISIISFIAIQLPPGDFMTSYVAGMRTMGENIEQEAIDNLRARYGLGEPVYVQYYKWMNGIILRGDWGQSMEWQKPVKELIGERLLLTVILSLVSLLVSWFIAIPIGVYSATHQYSIPDYVMSIISFIGVGVPGFLLALIIMYFAQTQLNMNVGGLFSEKYINAPWSLERVIDMLKHLWIPVVILAVEGTAGGIRTTRANLLDELNKPYVELARAKGLNEWKLIWKYPVRIALNPFFSTVGWSLASLISGATLISVVLSLQTTGPMQLRALTSQDMYLAGSFLLILSVLTIIGTLISDILLAWVDPRIRLEK
ncbi:MAG: ABC transporter permease [Chloroflexi bacterium]|nr:ABC transporter permease [Chloroflexota bacterium]